MPGVRNAFPTAAVVAVVAGFAVSASAAPLPTVPFTGEYHITVDGRPPVTVRLAHTPEKLRYLLTVRGQRLLVLADRTKKQVWLLNPNTKQYRKIPWNPKADLLAEMVPKAATSEKIGVEKMSGQEANKFRVAGATPSGGKFKGFLWITSANIVLKLEGFLTRGSGRARKMTIELKKLKVGPVDPARFVVPPGYTENKAGRKR